MEETFVRTEPSSIPQGLHGLFNKLERHRPDGRQPDDFIEEVFHTLRDELALSGVSVYGERRDGFELRSRVGEAVEPPAEFLQTTWPAVSLVLRHRVYIFADPQEPGSPAAFGFLPPGPSAGVVVGRRPHRRLLFFALDWGWERERVDFALNVLSAALGLYVLEERVRLSFEQVAEIQESLLREAAPRLPGWDIAYRSLPAEEVGGDFCDFVHVAEDLVGFAIGDASGHGLPAALLVRDIVTGLRMGLEKHLRMEYVFSKLNRVIHRSNVSSHYVSVFYGELESNGNLSYVNAGHQPPLLFRKDRIVELRTGGAVIGPLPQVSFRRGHVRLDPGSVLVLFTDGIVERRGPADVFFEEERLKRVVLESHGTPAGQLLDRILDVAHAHGEGRPWDDDVTVMVVRCPEE
jgi:sigma-B regulation protein RsbU (phosphoserine phosphatase)